MSNRAMNFWSFYDKVFLEEHQHPLNVAFHVAGTVSGLFYLIFIVFNTLFVSINYLGLVVLWPFILVVPGLLGHYLFEPNQTVGNLRINRKDYPGKSYF